MSATDQVEYLRRVAANPAAVLMAVARMAPRIERGATCVMISADRGERYLNTIYSNYWVKEHFGEVSELWLDLEAAVA
jgi:cysteine synthase A